MPLFSFLNENKKNKSKRKLRPLARETAKTRIDYSIKKDPTFEDVYDLSKSGLVEEVSGMFMRYRVAKSNVTSASSLGIFTCGISDCLGIALIIRDKLQNIRQISLIHSMSEHCPDLLQEEAL